MRLANKLTIFTTTLAFSVMSLSPVQADNVESKTTTLAESSVSASSAVKIAYERVPVKTTKAPPASEDTVLAPEESVVSPAPAATPAPASAPTAETPVAPQAASVKTVVAPAAPKPSAAPASSGKGAAIAAAAYAQLGVAQDCTALATNSLAAAGIHFHGWPAGYLSLGRTVSAAEAQAGDLAYYQNGGTGMAHIAVYVGNGMAVHGGWNGGTTSLQSVNIGSGPVFIRV